MIRKVRNPKVANSPTLPVGQPPRLVPISFFKLAQLILSINIKRTKSNEKKIFIFIFGMQLKSVAKQKHSSSLVTGFFKRFQLKQGVYHSTSITTVMFEPGKRKCFYYKANLYLGME